MTGMLQVELSGDPTSCSCPHCKMNNGTLCLFEAARRSLSALKPSVDHLQLSQLGVSKRLLNPQLYELHDDLPVTLWSADDGVDETQDPTGKSPADDIDRLGPEIAGNKVDEMEVNVQPATDQEEIWSDCTAELYPSHDEERVGDVAKSCASAENPSCCAAAKIEDRGNGIKLDGKTDVSLEADVNCRPTETDKNETEIATAHEPRQPSHVSTAPCEISTPSTTAAVVPGSVTTTTRPTGSVTTKPTKPSSAAVAKTTSTTACTTSLSKSDRPRASPCRASQSKQQLPSVTNGKESKSACKAPSAPTGKQSSLSNAAAAKLLVDMVGRSKSTAAINTSAAAAGHHSQCTQTHDADKTHSEQINVSADSGCHAEKTTRTPAGSGSSAGDRKDGKFCECWHCEFFGHMSVSYDDDDDDKIAYFTMRWKTRVLVLSTAPKT